MKALIVEDDHVAQSVLTRLLDAYAQVTTASNAADAIAQIEAASNADAWFDLICLDICLKDGDGKDILQRVRELEDDAGRFRRHERARVVMTTGNSDPKDIFSAFKKNCDGYLIKPIGRKMLQDELKRLELL